MKVEILFSDLIEGCKFCTALLFNHTVEIILLLLSIIVTDNCDLSKVTKGSVFHITI